MPSPTPAEIVAAMSALAAVPISTERAAQAAATTVKIADQARVGARWLTFESEPSNYAERLARPGEPA
jgi:hypothetical protein